ncbi:MAG: YCF48-related protein, partial [Nitrospiraceae bacterium]
LGTILSTQDGGASWTPQGHQESATFFDVFLTDESNGWAVGNAGALFQTTDGGVHWIDRTLPCGRTCNKLTDLIRIRFTGQQNGWIVGERGYILKTTNAGFNWIEQPNPLKLSFLGLSFPNPTQGWAAGENGAIVRIEYPTHQ